MKYFKGLLASFGVACIVTVSLFAQSTALIEGTVHDSSGALIAGATVTARNDDNGFTRTATTNGQGAYEVVSLPIGRYTVTASRDGFSQSQVPNIVLQVD